MAGNRLKSGEVPIHKKPESLMEVTDSGSPEDAQQVAVAKDDSLQTLFCTEHPEMAEALLSHCFEVLRAELGPSQCARVEQKKPEPIAALAAEAKALSARAVFAERRIWQ